VAFDSTSLLAWYARVRRPLPWRATRDPYALLVSEVMLQQTQAQRVVRYYETFLAAFPDPPSLAAAAPSAVLKAWSGLGYNRRALALQAAARRVAERGWPDDLTELPGVGPYTAAAVRAFALGEAVLPRDTNVLRIEERTGHRFDASCGQALMDLGRTVCLARVPRCDDCPLAEHCPSRGRRYGPLRKQSRFEGSFRQRRAAMLRLVAESPRQLEELDGEAVEALERDGLVATANGTVRLPA
jgi:A/G-specific adenine glycosylase